MMAAGGDRLVIEDAQLGGRSVHVEVGCGRVRGFLPRVPPGVAVIDAGGGQLLPGLADHHLHLFSVAASAGSVDLAGCRANDLGRVADAVRIAARHGRVRATGLDDGGGALLDGAALDAICDAVPVRVQYRTGSLWVLNRRALEAALAGVDVVPECFERGAAGLTGRVWRGDEFLRRHHGSAPPSLDALGAELARHGVTSVTDANPSTDPAQAEAIAAAAARMPQRLTLMSGVPGTAGAGTQGPLKILLDECSLPTPAELEASILVARRGGVPVAIHCVTLAELVLALSALDAAGTVAGDRIEHGMLVPPPLVTWLARLGLTVVCQPAFLETHGDRYRRRLDPEEIGALMPVATLLREGVRVAAGSDAPYGPLNPWRAIAAATQRRTRSGYRLGAEECLSAALALRLYLGEASDPGTPRVVAPGRDADLVVLKPGAVVGRDLDPVAVTLVAGRIAYRARGAGESLRYDPLQHRREAPAETHGVLT